jgi:photosystem II stability/assembly factor-like uncharacterized protein
MIIAFVPKISISQWTEQNTGIPFTLFSVSAVDDDIVWACASGTNIMRTTNSGTSWENVGLNIPPPQGVETNIFAIDQNNALFASYSGNPRTAYVYKTTNGGANWHLVLSQGSQGFITSIWIKPDSHGFMVGWHVGGRWSLWRTSDAGFTWDSTGLYIPETDPNVWSFENAMFYLGSNIWFGARGKGIYYSSNDGNTWTLQDLTSGGFPYPSGIWFDNLQNGYSSGNLNIIRTTNVGNNWSITPGSSGTEVIRGITGAGSQWWYVREINPGIYYTSNNGADWILQYTSPSGVGFKHITKARNGNTLWAVNISGNAAKYVITTSLPGNQEIVPSAFSLEQNFPNPFNPETIIKYQIPKTSFIKLKVFDMLGRDVKKLVHSTQSAGTYNVTFDASDLSSGIYFYTLEADGAIIGTKKMVLVK